MNAIVGIIWMFFILLVGAFGWLYWCSIQCVETNNIWYFLIAVIGAIFWVIVWMWIIPSDESWCDFKPKNDFEECIKNWWTK
jgi:membrane protein YdbS with pleckstrin-like domain